MSLETFATRFAAHHGDTVLAQLREVVDVNSGTGNLPGVRAMLDWYERAFRDAGLTDGGPVEGLEGRPHVLLRGGGGGEGAPRILLLGHVDTVYAPEHPFQRFEVRGERAHGPGVSDMKGGLLVAAWTVRALREVGALAGARITAFLNSDEEVQSPTSRGLLAELCRAERFDMALVFEGGRRTGALVRARKGVGKYVLVTTGRAAHSGMNPEAGINAIEELAAKIVPIQALTDHDAGLTLNVGTFHGGVGRNTVPPEARCEIDVRLWRPEDEVAVDAALRSIAAQVRLPGATTRIDGGVGRPAWPPNDASDRLAAHWAAAAQALGQTVDAETTGGGSDGNLTHAAGVPTLDALGPQGGNPHTPEEYIEIRSLGERIALHTVALGRLAGAV